MSWLTVRFIPDGPVVEVPIESDHTALARRPGSTSLVAVSTLTQLSWVFPGWGEGSQAHFSGGVRLFGWWRWFHADLGLKLSTFSVPWIAALPGGLAIDAFVGFPVNFTFEAWELRVALDVGVWSTFCPALRLATSARFSKWVVSLEYATHIYPMAFVAPSDRPATEEDVPFANYLFWSLGAAVGLRL